MTAIAAVDMFMVATVTFKLLYAVIVLSHHRRRVIHFEVTQNPTQAWLARQITEAFPWDTAPRYLLRDRDTSYGICFQNRVRAMGIEELLTAPRSPWQNALAAYCTSWVEWVATDGGRCGIYTVFALILVFDWRLRAGLLEEGFALVVVAIRP